MTEQRSILKDLDPNYRGRRKKQSIKIFDRNSALAICLIAAITIGTVQIISTQKRAESAHRDQVPQPSQTELSGQHLPKEATAQAMHGAKIMAQEEAPPETQSQTITQNAPSEANSVEPLTPNKKENALHLKREPHSVKQEKTYAEPSSSDAAKILSVLSPKDTGDKPKQLDYYQKRDVEIIKTIAH